VALYVGGFFWTLHYDTVYAHQDKEDDALIGVKSTALLFGIRSKRWMSLFAAAAAILFAAALTLDGAGWPAWLGLAAVAAHLAWQVADVDLDDAADCLAKFRSNRWVGWLFLAGIVAAHLAA
jgi:4-hydroxybenzoate polyprenyltransferase